MERTRLSRRQFLLKAALTSGAVVSLASCASESDSRRRTTGAAPVRWERDRRSRLFRAVSWAGEPLVRGSVPRLLDGGCRLLDEPSAQITWLQDGRPAARHGPLRMELRHQLHDSGSGLGKDLLEAELTVRNLSGEPHGVELVFATSVRPSPCIEKQEIHVPLTAAGLSRDGRFAALGVKQFLQDCRQHVDAGDFQAHPCSTRERQSMNGRPLMIEW